MSVDSNLSNSQQEKPSRDIKPPQPWYWVPWPRLRKFLIWALFFLFVYMMSSFLTLAFLTFILSYTINSLIRHLCNRVSWPRWVVVLVIYFLIGIIVWGMGMVVVPKIYHEGVLLYGEIPAAKAKLFDHLKTFREDQEYAMFLEGTGIEEAIRERFTSVVQSFTRFVQTIFRTSFHLLLSIIFSFLILWDLDRFRQGIQSLRKTRVRRIYTVLSPRLIQFGDILGRAFEAQIIIALLNTLFTLIGLTWLKMSSKLFLSLIIFVCSFIPVAGVFISSLPICLLAYKDGGFFLVFQGMTMIAIIHFIEAYLLNPRIVGAHMSLHPFVSVCILVISEYLAGIWGLLLGVPCAVFLYQAMIMRQNHLLDKRNQIPENCGRG